MADTFSGVRNYDFAPENKTTDPSVLSDPEKVIGTGEILSNLNREEQTGSPSKVKELGSREMQSNLNLEEQSASPSKEKGFIFLTEEGRAMMRRAVQYPAGKELEVPEFLKKYPLDPRYWMEWSFHNVKELSEISDQFKRNAAKLLAEENLHREVFHFALFSEGPLAHYTRRYMDHLSEVGKRNYDFKNSMLCPERKRARVICPLESAIGPPDGVKKIKPESGQPDLEMQRGNSSSSNAHPPGGLLGAIVADKMKKIPEDKRGYVVKLVKEMTNISAEEKQLMKEKAELEKKLEKKRGVRERQLVQLVGQYYNMSSFD
ncbi:hypothetical protein O6P43_000759 [Quillaja saponaria]|uniref:Uncharacterized protein n=1 Tax=Quillaja saponaria TaxID=32244 RepID=A0AAD7QHA0_QUISA|nr:hypothetical protein O6P43_000759 [Quillaja saponaria]